LPYPLSRSLYADICPLQRLRKRCLFRHSLHSCRNAAQKLQRSRRW
jgi:hypothetical protein